MSPVLRRLAAGGLVLLALAGTADAQTAQKKKPPSFAVPPPPPLRGAQATPQPAPRTTAPRTPAPDAAASAQSVDPSLRSALPPSADTTGRLGGLEAEQPGGAQCRSDCAQVYYFCLSNQGDDTCSTNWTQCLLACPTNSSSF